jgi:hypothetical protein
MNGEGAEGLVVDRRIPVAANEEEFTIVSREHVGPGRTLGWDPYEVWRTRVKAPLKSRKDRRRDRGR